MSDYPHDPADWPKGFPDMSNTAEALERYDAQQTAIFEKWENAETDEDVDEAERFEKKCVDEVRRAYFEDTKDRNSLDNCMLLSVGWARQLVKMWDDEQ